MKEKQTVKIVHISRDVQRRLDPELAVRSWTVNEGNKAEVFSELEKVDLLAKEARERYDGEDGLKGLETALGLVSNGNDVDRIAALVTEIGARINVWKGTSPSKLIQDHEIISSLFALTEKVGITSYVNGGTLPDLWWAKLAVNLESAGIYDDLVRQIHRETHALAARSFVNDERSFGGKAKAANAPEHPDKKPAIEYAKKYSGVSAVQIKTRLGLRASERTIRGWLRDAGL